MAYVGLSLSGVLWLNGTTVINEQSAYNNGLLRIQDYIDAHTSNTTQGTTAPDQHDWTHILLPTLVGGDIAVASSNSPANLGIWGKSVMTRIHNLEGNGSDWATGSAVASVTALNTALANLVSGATVIAHATAASSLDTPQAMATLVADYKVKISGANGTVLVAVGGAYVDSLGGYVAADAVQRTVSLPAQPSAGNIQYCWITKPPTVPIPHASTNGVVGASPAVPAYPSGEEPLALVIWRGSAAGGIVAAADIIDIRYGHGGSTSSGGGGTYTPVSPLVAIGSFGTTIQLDQILTGTYVSATPVNGVRVDQLRIPDKMISSVVTDASLADQQAYLATGPFKSSIQAGTASGTLLFNPPVGVPLTVQIGTNKKRLDSTMSAASRTTNNITAFGAGVYMMVADLTATGPGWVPLLYGAGTAVPQPSTTQMLLGYVVWDGSSFYLNGRNGEPQWVIQPTLNAANYQPLGAFRPVESGENYSSLALAASPTQIPFSGHTSQLTVQIPNGGMSARVSWSALVTAPGSVQQFYLFPMYYNVIGGTFAEAANVPRFAENTIPAAGAKTLAGWGRIQPINGGPLVVTLGYISSLVGFGIQQIQWDVEVTKQ